MRKLYKGTKIDLDLFKKDEYSIAYNDEGQVFDVYNLLTKPLADFNNNHCSCIVDENLIVLSDWYPMGGYDYPYQTIDKRYLRRIASLYSTVVKNLDEKTTDR